MNTDAMFNRYAHRSSFEATFVVVINLGFCQMQIQQTSCWIIERVLMIEEMKCIKFNL